MGHYRKEANELENGALVIDRTGDIVLAKWRNEFVTWVVDKAGNAYHGHYFVRYIDAHKDYLERRKVAKEG